MTLPQHHFQLVEYHQHKVLGKLLLYLDVSCTHMVHQDFIQNQMN